LLFCPGNRPEMIAKLGRFGADGVAIDLEDGVPARDKEAARLIAREGATGLLGTHPNPQVFVRVNQAGSPWIQADIAEGVDQGTSGIIVPKLERLDQLQWVARELDNAGLTDAKIIGGLETVEGIESCVGLTHPRLVALYFGAEDYIADIGGERTVSNHEVAYARSRVVTAARLLGVAALDQAVVEIDEHDRFFREAVEARQLGYTGKVCLHPGQVALANQVFTPTVEEVDRSRRILAAADEAAQKGRGVVLFEGQMVDLPILRQAARLLERAAIPSEKEMP